MTETKKTIRITNYKCDKDMRMYIPLEN